MGKLKYLIIHCTATPQGRKVSSEDIKHWHIVGRGWSRVGYSDMIHLDGSLENLIPFNQDDTVDPWEISNGARGFNGVSRHVVYVGGLSKNLKPMDTRTRPQKDALLTYVKYMILRHPDIQVLGHGSVANKACPSFNVARFLSLNGIAQKNIFKPQNP